MQGRNELFIGITVILLLALAGWLALSNSVMAAPDVRMQTIDGETIVLSELKGQPVLITFWSTTCSPCIKEMPHLVELYNQLGSKGLTIIAISMVQDQVEQVATMRNKKRLNYTIAPDFDGQLAKEFGDVRLTPTTILINTEGNIVFRQLGRVDFHQLSSDIKSMLRENV